MDGRSTSGEPWLSASMMCADPLCVAAEIGELEAARIDALHMDVMDGHFVRNFGIGLDWLKSVRRATALPFEIHLMVENPESYVKSLEELRPGLVYCHAESTPQIHRALSAYAASGFRVGLALNPGTPLNAIEPVLEITDSILLMTVNPGFAGQHIVPGSAKRVEMARLVIGDRRSPLQIAVDGNIDAETAPVLAGAGATAFVLGSSGLFIAGERRSDSLRRIREAITGRLNGDARC